MNLGDLCTAQQWAPGYNFVSSYEDPKKSDMRTNRIQHKQIYVFLGMDSGEKQMGRFLLPDGTVWLSDPMFMETLP